MSTHIEAKKEDIAKIVIMPGDPNRARFMANKFLTDIKEINTVRAMYGYTGNYKGKKVTIMAHGMGMPSIGIYSYELYKDYDVDLIIRVGSVGAYADELEALDIVLVSESYSDSNYAKVQNNTLSNLNYPSLIVNKKLKEIANKLNINIHEGRVYSSDVFYSDSIDHLKMYKQNNCLGTEMESFALFHNARILNKKASCLLTVSNHFYKDIDISAKEREEAMDKMFIIALESL